MTIINKGLNKMWFWELFLIGVEWRYLNVCLHTIYVHVFSGCLEKFKLTQICTSTFQESLDKTRKGLFEGNNMGSYISTQSAVTDTWVRHKDNMFSAWCFVGS